MGDAPIFCQMKGLMGVHNNNNNGLLGPNSPKYDPILLKLAPEVVFKETQTVFQEF